MPLDPSHIVKVNGMSKAINCQISAFKGPIQGVKMQLNPYHVVSTPMSTSNWFMACLKLFIAPFLLLKALYKELGCHWTPVMLLALKYQTLQLITI